MNCSLAQSLNIPGERRALLIIRDAMFGAKRFGPFQRSLGISRNILTTRLNRRVEERLMEKRPAAEISHDEYVLTQAGLDREPVLPAITEDGKSLNPGGLSADIGPGGQAPLTSAGS